MATSQWFFYVLLVFTVLQITHGGIVTVQVLILGSYSWGSRSGKQFNFKKIAEIPYYAGTDGPLLKDILERKRIPAKIVAELHTKDPRYTYSVGPFTNLQYKVWHLDKWMTTGLIELTDDLTFKKANIGTNDNLFISADATITRNAKAKAKSAEVVGTEKKVETKKFKSQQAKSQRYGDYLAELEDDIEEDKYKLHQLQRRHDQLMKRMHRKKRRNYYNYY